MTPKGIWTINSKKEAKLLRKKAADYDFSKVAKEETRKLVRLMREEMKKSDGIGLSANQIGLYLNVFVAQVDNKFYAVFNPKITSRSEEEVIMEEGCLSVPETFGPVPRSEKVVLEGYDQNGRKIKIKAWGLLARVFQHETDHLSGKVFIDRAKKTYKIEAQK